MPAFVSPTTPPEPFPCPESPITAITGSRCFPFPGTFPVTTVPVAFARNGAGTEVTATFWVKVFPKKFHSRDIVLTDKNMQKVVGELDPEGTGSLVDRFVKLNREMRKANGSNHLRSPHQYRKAHSLVRSIRSVRRNPRIVLRR